MTQDIADVTCEEASAEVLTISKAEKGRPAETLFTISDISEVRRTSDRLDCNGTALWLNGEETGLEFHMEIAPSGDAYYGYESLEEPAVLDMANVTCPKISDLLKAQGVMVGSSPSSTIVRMSNMEETVRSSTRVECTGTALLNDGSRTAIGFYFESTPGGGISYGTQTMDTQVAAPTRIPASRRVAASPTPRPTSTPVPTMTPLPASPSRSQQSPPTPTPIPPFIPDNPPILVSAGAGHSCTVLPDSSVECWGNDELGQSTPPDGAFVSVDTGLIHSCGLRESGLVECWGANVDLSGGEVGQSRPPAGVFNSISVGALHTCGLRQDSFVECWGANTDTRGDFSGQAASPEGLFISVSAGVAHTCGLKKDGSVECWGGDSLGQSSSPEGSFLSVSAGGVHSCGLRPDHSVECWGNDADGITAPPAGPFTYVSAGGLHSCGLRPNASVECWGVNEQGQARPPAGSFLFISSGLAHSCGLKQDGTIECWGSNEEGQATTPGGTTSPSTGLTQQPEPDVDAGFSFANPISRGDAMVYENGLLVGVVGVVENATQMVLEHSPLFASPPQRGHQYLIVTLGLYNTGPEPIDLWLILGNLGLVGKAGVSYPSGFMSECLFFPNELDMFATIFPEGKLTGNVCFSVPTPEVHTLRLFSEDMTGQFLFWSLQ